MIDVGGGFRGVFGTGVLDACLETNIDFDCCIGVSAGSGNLVSYLTKKIKRSYRYYIKYGLTKENTSISNFIKTGNYVDLDYVYGTVAKKNGPCPLDYDALSNSRQKFTVVATNAVTGEPHYFDKADMSYDNYDILKASSALPMVCKPYVIDDVAYYDGGISDPIPFEKAFSYGCDKVVVILTRPKDYLRTPKKDFLPALAIKNQYPKTSEALKNRYKTYNRQLEIAKQYEKEGKLLIVAPSYSSGLSTFTKNPDKLKQLYNEGRNAVGRIINFLND
ncbi:MAG: patatin family protein [Clostridia bacterium]|nr:patatin family protein [Clostridia bacterium]